MFEPHRADDSERVNRVGDVAVGRRVLTAPDVIKYDEEVTASMGGPIDTQQFFRLFLAPGMGHCNGGPGPNTLDALTALETWVEKGIAPEQIIASRRRADGSIERTRPLCVYPKVARWSGRGSTDDAANFSCVNPGPSSTDAVGDAF